MTSSTATPLLRDGGRQQLQTCSPASESRDPVGSSAKTTPGPVDEGPGDRDPLRLASGQLARPPVLLAGQAEPGEPPGGLGLGVRRVGPR